MLMHAGAQLLADPDRTVADRVIWLVKAATTGLAARPASRAGFRSPQHDAAIHVKEISSDRSIVMPTQNYHIDSNIPDRDQPSHCPDPERCCYVAIPSELLDDQSDIIEQVIQFAFDTLGTRH